MSELSGGAPCWLELGGTPSADVLAHYAAHLGWTYDMNPEDSGYRRAFADGFKVAGFGGPAEPRPERGWRVYIAVDDVDAGRELAVHAGAPALGAIISVPDGRFAWLHHPLGGHMGLFESQTDPGTAVCPGVGRISGWTQESPDCDGVRSFHQAVFGPGFPTLVDYQTSTRAGWIVRVTAEVDHALDLQDPAGNRLRLEPATPSDRTAAGSGRRALKSFTCENLDEVHHRMRARNLLRPQGNDGAEAT
ncbi:VOC family protein [Nocardioides terrisoli]|uniref:VOC family protein n=1 Tax=Nocardioides terrisoli TaxID=3388267 RepID=UPI00287B7AA6|nr:hypothetical protein [Nocardioides marmorisolisilvae]